jgi:hypothetical protein
MNIRIAFIFLILLSSSSIAIAQEIDEDKHWCKLNCDPDIHRKNAMQIYQKIHLASTKKELENFKGAHFPLRFVYVAEEFIKDRAKKEAELEKVVENLNISFKSTKFTFSFAEMEELKTDLKIEDLSGNQDNSYGLFSDKYDKKDMITVYILDHKNEFCTVTENSISCSRTGGFSYILSDRANNVVMSQFDLSDSKIIAHEFGHFFGLFHTFETALFGDDMTAPDFCTKSGDLICDTPVDPGTVFEVYVNYTTCEMIGNKDFLGNEFKPIIQNFMSYYKPCYLKENLFTEQQSMVMQLASQIPFRQVLSRPLEDK